MCVRAPRVGLGLVVARPAESGWFTHAGAVRRKADPKATKVWNTTVFRARRNVVALGRSAVAVLADGRAEQAADCVCEGKTNGAPDDQPHDGAADVAAAEPGADGTSQRKSDKDSGKRERDP